MNERRLARLQEQIKEHLAMLLLRDLADPKLGFITVTRVELDAEFTQCKAYWSVLGKPTARAESAQALDRARGYCQREMGKALHTRSVPHLEFVFDEGIEGAIRTNQLLADLKAEREANERRAAEGKGPGDAPGLPPATPS